MEVCAEMTDAERWMLDARVERRPTASAAS